MALFDCEPRMCNRLMLRNRALVEEKGLRPFAVSALANTETRTFQRLNLKFTMVETDFNMSAFRSRE